jgi:hypothetical protein
MVFIMSFKLLKNTIFLLFYLLDKIINIVICLF